MKYTHFIFAFTLLLFSSTVQAQTPGEFTSKGFYLVNVNALEEIKEVLTGVEENIWLIDLSLSEGELTELTLTKKEEIVFEDDLYGLPKDGIYELDLSKFKKGTYSLVLKSNKQTMTREVVVE